MNPYNLISVKMAEGGEMFLHHCHVKGAPNQSALNGKMTSLAPGSEQYRDFNVRLCYIIKCLHISVFLGYK